MILTLAIPDDVAVDLGASEQAVEARVQADLAVLYYAEGKISIGRACEFAGLKRGDFEDLLARRKVVRSYSEEDWALDLAWAAR